MEQYVETAFLLNGTAVLLVGIWGLWVLGQMPLAWMRSMRWAGLGFLLVNLVFALAQWHGWMWHLGSWHPVDIYPDTARAYHLKTITPSGILGLDRSLGASAVAWMPILVVWRWWLGILPLVVLILASKSSAWIGASVALAVLAPVRARWKAMLLIAGIAVALAFDDGVLLTKLTQRWQTWGPMLAAISDRPWIGHGWSPFAWSRAQSLYGMRLPSAHSDWLALAFHGGILLTTFVALAWKDICASAPATRWARALRASLIACAVMALGQSIVSEAAMLGTVSVLLCWYWIEQRQGVLA